MGRPASMRGGFLLINAGKGLQHAFVVVQQLPESLQTGSVGRLGQPKAQVAALAILVVQVVQGALQLLVAGEGGVVLETVLQAAAHQGVRVYLAVGFGHNFAVDAAGLVVGRRAVVLHGLCHDFYVGGREPPGEARIVPHQVP